MPSLVCSTEIFCNSFSVVAPTTEKTPPQGVVPANDCLARSGRLISWSWPSFSAKVIRLSRAVTRASSFGFFAGLFTGFVTAGVAARAGAAAAVPGAISPVDSAPTSAVPPRPASAVRLDTP